MVCIPAISATVVSQLDAGIRCAVHSENKCCLVLDNGFVIFVLFLCNFVL
jgi:hypothetical protein